MNENNAYPTVMATEARIGSNKYNMSDIRTDDLENDNGI